MQSDLRFRKATAALREKWDGERMREKAETSSEPITDVRASCLDEGSVSVWVSRKQSHIELGVHNMNWGGMPVKDKGGMQDGRGSLRPPCLSDA